MFFFSWTRKNGTVRLRSAAPFSEPFSTGRAHRKWEKVSFWGLLISSGLLWPLSLMVRIGMGCLCVSLSLGGHSNVKCFYEFFFHGAVVAPPTPAMIWKWTDTSFSLGIPRDNGHLRTRPCVGWSVRREIWVVEALRAIIFCFQVVDFFFGEEMAIAWRWAIHMSRFEGYETGRHHWWHHGQTVVAAMLDCAVDGAHSCLREGSWLLENEIFWPDKKKHGVS